MKKNKDDLPCYRETVFGFIYGAAEVTRVASHKGHVILSINTPRERLLVRVTPTGLIRTEKLNPKRREEK